ncbi:MAG: hypothetical protein E6J21_06695 [Chloroflexota bacterium]|nr:MAG: hypothetical protein E6J21_06695 [Chloroflexota bacterium]
MQRLSFLIDIHAFLSGVNACVILRRNNFDPLLIFSPRMTTYRVLRSVCSATRANQRCAPHLRKVRLHLDILWWTAGAETSEREVYRRATCARSSRLPSLPQASRSNAPFAPAASTRSLQVPTEQGLSTPGAPWLASDQRQRLSRQGEITPTPSWLAPAYF